MQPHVNEQFSERTLHALMHLRLVNVRKRLKQMRFSTPYSHTCIADNILNHQMINIFHHDIKLKPSDSALERFPTVMMSYFVTHKSGIFRNGAKMFLQKHFSSFVQNDGELTLQ